MLRPTFQMPKTRPENTACHKLAQKGAIGAEHACATCVDIMADDLGPRQLWQDQRVCELLGVAPSERPPRKKMKARSPQHMEQFATSDFRAPHVSQRRPKYQGEHVRSFMSPGGMAQPASTKDTMKAVCEAGGGIPSDLAAGRAVRIKGKFTDLSQKMQSSAQTTARAMIAGSLALVLPDDPLALLAASLANPTNSTLLGRTVAERDELRAVVAELQAERWVLKKRSCV